MRLRAYIVIAGLACAAIVAVFAIRHEDTGADAGLAIRIIRAVQAYSGARIAAGGRTPSAVSFRELIAGGFLSESDAHRFGAADVSVSLSVDDSRPEAVLIRARMPDGRGVCLMTDGSVQKVRP